MKLYNKIRNWYFSRNALPYWLVLLADSTIVFITSFFSYYILYGGGELANHFWQILHGSLLSVAVMAVFFKIFHTYRSVLRFSSFVDLARVALAVILGNIVLLGLHYVLPLLGLYPSKIYIADFLGELYNTMGEIILMWAMRIVVKTVFESYTISDRVKPVFIYGCMQGGVALAKSIKNSTDSPYKLEGFISADPDLKGSFLLGTKVYANNSELIDTILQKKVSTILVSPQQTEKFLEQKELIDQLVQHDIRIMMMPREKQWDGKSELSHLNLHEVEIEDLLPRQKIEVDMMSIGALLNGHRILITGAAGSIGAEMARQVAKFAPSELILVDQAETPMHDMRLYMAKNHADLKVWTIVGSITNEGQMEDIFSAHKPEYVFHAAAYKHVPMMEDNPAMAVQNNVYGTRVIADLAVKYGTRKFVMISTDKAVNPTNVMGCSKRICEIYCQSLNAHQDTTQFITTRFGNVLGSNGSVIPLFREQIKAGGPVTVTHPDIIRYFMLIPEACRLVLEAGTMGKGGEIFVFDMGEPVKIADLARRMIDLSGAKDVEIKYTGLRDGEKLYEEVLSYAEHTKPTLHPKIMVASVREYPYELALKNEKELYEISFSYDDMAIVRKMKEIVPEYKSKQSKYEVLD